MPDKLTQQIVLELREQVKRMKYLMRHDKMGEAFFDQEQYPLRFTMGVGSDNRVSLDGEVLSASVDMGKGKVSITLHLDKPAQKKKELALELLGAFREKLEGLAEIPHEIFLDSRN